MNYFVMPKSLVSVVMLAGFSFCAFHQMTTDYYARHYRETRVQSAAEMAGLGDELPRLGDPRIRNWLDSRGPMAAADPEPAAPRTLQTRDLDSGD